MPDTTQQIAYIPMIFPDADFSRSEVNSLPLIQSIDKSIKELKQNLYEHQRVTEHRLSNLENDVSDLKKSVTTLQSEVSELKSDMKIVHTEVNDLKGDIKVMNTKIESLDKRLDDATKSQNSWFMVLGFLAAAVPIAVAIVQHFVGH